MPLPVHDAQTRRSTATASLCASIRNNIETGVTGTSVRGVTLSPVDVSAAVLSGIKTYDKNDEVLLCVINVQGEFNCARDFFYRYVTESCKDIERRRSGRLVATTHNGYTVQSKQTQRHTTLVKDEASWAARAEFGLASMELRECVSRQHMTFSLNKNRKQKRERKAGDMFQEGNMSQAGRVWAVMMCFLSSRPVVEYINRHLHVICSP